MAMTFTTPKVGKNTFIHPTALIGDNVTIGDNCYIGPYCIVGYPAEWKGYETIDKGVVIGSNVRLTGLVTVDSGVQRATIISDNCYLMKHCHIGHDVALYNDVTVSCGAKIGGHAVIHGFCNIGLNAVIHQKCLVPTGCMIGASSFVGKKSVLREYYKYVGVPIRELCPNNTL